MCPAGSLSDSAGGRRATPQRAEGDLVLDPTCLDQAARLAQAAGEGDRETARADVSRGGCRDPDGDGQPQQQANHRGPASTFGFAVFEKPGSVAIPGTRFCLEPYFSDRDRADRRAGRGTAERLRHLDWAKDRDVSDRIELSAVS